MRIPTLVSRDNETTASQLAKLTERSSMLCSAWQDDSAAKNGLSSMHDVRLMWLGAARIAARKAAAACRSDEANKRLQT